METETYKLLARSLINPEGIVELYHNSIGDEPGARVPSLLTAAREHPELRMDEKQHFNYGMAMRYRIAQERGGSRPTTISLEFIATHGSQYPALWDEKNKRHTLHADPHYLCDLALFDYSPQESVALGQQVLAGERASLLQHELFQELQQNDPQFDTTRQKIGEYMVALGTLAQDIISEQRVWVGYNTQKIYGERLRKKERELWRKAPTETPSRDEVDDVPF